MIKASGFENVLTAIPPINPVEQKNFIISKSSLSKSHAIDFLSSMPMTARAQGAKNVEGESGGGRFTQTDRVYSLH